MQVTTINTILPSGAYDFYNGSNNYTVLILGGLATPADPEEDLGGRTWPALGLSIPGVLCPWLRIRERLFSYIKMHKRNGVTVNIG